MSEYQYYEFQAVDRLLDEKEMQVLRRYSTRAEIEPDRFFNEYQRGDFKGNPGLWMEKYFDGYLYFANWGTHELHLRVPAKSLSLKTAQENCPGHDLESGAAVREKDGKLIFVFVSQDEYGDDGEEEYGPLALFLPLREDLCRGDMRALYVAWLLTVQGGAVSEDEVEPPVPPNPGTPSPALRKLIQFLRIDD